jgi:DMSO/TMAO reductase YedYZ molybdopterin-dependent catalytic subunit
MSHFSLDHPHDPLRPHSHDPNPTPPSDNPDFVFVAPDGTETTITLPELEHLPRTTIPNCYIVSTGHGTSGPFTFSGARLLDLIQSQLPPTLGWSQVEVISADGFGNRVMAKELFQPDPAGPALLSYTLDGQPLTRRQGLVRLIVPSEKDDALRQVKWVGRVVVRD